jgi:hypothetical protein
LNQSVVGSWEAKTNPEIERAKEGEGRCGGLSETQATKRTSKDAAARLLEEEENNSRLISRWQK